MSAKILIVDDSPEMIDILRDILPKDIKKQVAINGINALRLLNSSRELPDLILLDIMMPGIDGFQVCRRIKRVSRLREIPIIFIRALNESFDKVKAFEVGAVDYITKPFNREEVLARIDTHLELYNSKNVIKRLYSETIQGTIGAMNDMLAIANPEVSKFSNSMKLYSEKIMEELEISDVWDLKLACVLSGLGMLSENMKKATTKYISNKEKLSEDIDGDIEKAYKSLSLSNDIINRIPRFDAITKIIEKAMNPLEDKYRNIPLENVESEVLKGQILRIMISYIHKFEKEKNYIKILDEMKESKEEFYFPQILDKLAKVQNDLINNDVSNVSINELRPNMILVDNLYCPDGRLMLKSGYELSEEMIMLIKNFGLLEDIRLKVMGS